jgi:hypothetical protein
MKNNVPSYIEQSFKDTIRSHFNALQGQDVLSKSEYKEIHDRSIEALTALEACETREERDAIYDDLNSKSDKFGKAVHNIVAATDHQMHAKGNSAYGQRNMVTQTPAAETSMDLS